MVFVDPVLYAFDHELSHEWLIRGCLVTAARTVAVGAIGILTIIIIGIGLLEIRMLDVVCVVIHHVENHGDARLMESLHHLLELTDAYSWLVGISGITSLWHIVVHWVVAPVILRLVQPCFIHRAIIV